MSIYLKPILTACYVFPVLAALFTLPYIIYDDFLFYDDSAASGN